MSAATVCILMAEFRVCDALFLHREEHYLTELCTLHLTLRAYLSLAMWQACRAKWAHWRCGKSRGDDHHFMGELRRSQDMLMRGITGASEEHSLGAIWFANHFCALLFTMGKHV